MTTEPVSLPAEPVRHKLLGLRLSIMMFLQYAVWGTWLPVIARYYGAPAAEGGLGFKPADFGWLFSIPGVIGAIAAPFIAGQIADRYFSLERLMAVFLAVGGLLWVALAYQTNYWSWMVLLTAASLVYVPTLALSNSLAFSHMTDPKRQFPRVRIWGTLGWIAAGWAFSAAWLKTGLYLQWKPPFFGGKDVPVDRVVDALKAGGVMSLGYALYCLLALPHTPPKRQAAERLAFRKAFRLFTNRSFAVLMGAGLFIAGVHNLYFMHTSNFLPQIGLADADLAPAMSIGQFAELGMMVLLGWMLKRLGFRVVLAIGATAYVVRFAVFGSMWLPTWVIVASQGLHGVCFACYYAAAFIYVDRLADADVRHSAQTVVGIVLGLGPLLGGWINSQLAGWFTPAGGKLNYSQFWYAVTLIALVATIFLALAFRDQTKHLDAPGE